MTREQEGAFAAYTVSVWSRLEAGAEAYEDRSFSKDPVELVRELQQEALDLAGWGFVLWSRLRALESAAASVSSRPTDPDEEPPR